MCKMIINFNGPIHVCGAGVSQPEDFREIRQLLYNIVETLESRELDALYGDEDEDEEDDELDFLFEDPAHDGHSEKDASAKENDFDDDAAPIVFSFFVMDPAAYPVDEAVALIKEKIAEYLQTEHERNQEQDHV